MFNKVSFNSGTVTHLVVGLGNPGKQYEFTRHNAGFMAVDLLAKKYNFDVKRLKFKSLVGECTISNKRILVMKPSTFMNNSGEAVVEAMQFYKIPPENVIVLFDDISIEPGKLRVRRKGSDGGHNGIKSIIFLTGSDDFPRIKIGVGAKPHPEFNLADWVLSRLRPDEFKLLEEASEKSLMALELILQGNVDTAMNQYN